ncbi:MAG: radical SAM family heme chaperone HemW [Gammaproteobacteria bacterium]|nr:radical SAM family heme chaperone HemW [Gammaproteobacteria bacterium]
METADLTQQQPLSIYIHLPWCLHKCAYCDFNSHATEPDQFPETLYTKQLIADLTQSAKLIDCRKVKSIFIGGGTPSLFSPESIAKILTACADETELLPDCEITLETNPSTFEYHKFAEFLSAGVNRLSVGAQSFNNDQLSALGRIHNATEAINALETAHKIGFRNINVDLMFGLPNQTVENALADIKTACRNGVNHISYYQLTLEPNTVFHRFPPKLPSDEISWEIQTNAIQILLDSGYHRYEVSAYARANAQCIHNSNYWQYGDYLGIGAGAHSKITTNEGVLRNQRTRQPESYIQAVDNQSHILQQHQVTKDQLVFEFMLNNLRLVNGFNITTFTSTTGLRWSHIKGQIQSYIEEGLMEKTHGNYRASHFGYQFLDELTQRFLPA